MGDQDPLRADFARHAHGSGHIIGEHGRGRHEHPDRFVVHQNAYWKSLSRTEGGAVRDVSLRPVVVGADVL